MKLKRLLSILLLVVLTTMLVGCQTTSGGEEAKELVIFTWADYLPQEVLDRFEAETGIKVTYTYFTSNDEMLAKLDASQGGDYDLVLASDYAVDIANKQGLMQKLDKNVLTRFGDIDPAFQSYYYDANNEYTVPFAAGCPLIVYDPAKVDASITGYASLWDESLRDSVVVMDDARVMIGITLKSLGYTLNETGEKLEEGGERLMSLRPNIRAFDYDTPHEKVISGDATVGFMFTPQASWALAERDDLKVVYPEEGFGFGIDSFFIPSKAPHPKAANEFLNYILQGEVSAELSEYAMYMNCVTTAKEHLSAEYMADPALYIPKEELKNLDMCENLGAEAEARYAEIWTVFKQS